ncbi:hypothetical protein EIK76_08865 [Rheinheimera mesophila]|uniref:Prepilin-type N-terminal cleavage/methylation domain-containing protein n=1 Tax=Rheinheimera mesophila TaxID=1547515 RepID=A0A3P3QIN0_9GAMM|nr:hypothetical protein [Rheinheimera mesophila]KKL03005.1 hypothetical protein SD53_02675 [Rheinheimera mesophila]RRJ20988.1 hypothetical protein EIK76_08865 [Rheinheimera mesophila]
MRSGRAINIALHYGLTLVELLIGLTLGIILIWGGIQIFVAGQHAYRESQRFSVLQGHVSFVTDSVLNDVRGASAVALNASFDTLTINQGAAVITYQLTNDAELHRTVTGEAAAVIADNIQTVLFSCLDAESVVVACGNAVTLLTQVQLSTGAADYSQQHQFSFRVALRNAVMTQKFVAAASGG